MPGVVGGVPGKFHPWPSPSPSPRAASPALTEVQEQGRPGLHAEHAVRPRRATRTRGTLEGASRHSRQRGRGDHRAAGLPSHHALLLPLPPGAGNTGRRQGGHGTAGEPGSGVPGVLQEVRSSCGRPPSCALCALPAAPPPASCKD